LHKVQPVPLQGDNRPSLDASEFTAERAYAPLLEMLGIKTVTSCP